MAIVKMKKLRVVAMADSRKELLKGLQRLGCVQICEPKGIDAESALHALFYRQSSELTAIKNEAAEVNTAIEALKRYAQKKDGIFLQRRPVTEEAFFSEDTAQKAREISRNINAALQDLSRLQSEEGRLLSGKAGLLPWQELDLPLETEGTEHTVFRMGVCPAAIEVQAARNALAEFAAEVYEVSNDKLQRYLLAIFHRSEEQEVQDVLRVYGFSAVAFSDITGTARENILILDRCLAENREQQAAAIGRITDYADGWDVLRLYADRLSAEAAKNADIERLLTNGTVLFLEGWAPAERMDEVQLLLEQQGCAWETEDPLEEEYPDVPVSLKNNLLTRPLSMVTEMYSLPAYHTVDPNPLMAPFFILFYGIMMADMGYGLLMILASVFIMKKAKPNGPTMRHMIPLLGLCGVSTFVMGALTGGFFGDFLTQLVELIRPGTNFVLPALFTPLDNILLILIGSMCLGFIHILTGMLVSVIRKARSGQIMDAFWNEITWWIVFAGIALMVTGVTNLLLYAGIALVVLGPILNNKGLGKITGIFASLYNNVTGYFGDILSYCRLMALMLAGSVIAQVFNTLGAIPGNVVIFLVIATVGNLLNFGLNLLGCYVHDMRLQCLEFFGKFYEDGGKPFRPLQINTKYVDIQ